MQEHHVLTIKHSLPYDQEFIKSFDFKLVHFMKPQSTQSNGVMLHSLLLRDPWFPDRYF